MFLNTIVYADSPQDANGIHKCASYTYIFSTKTFNCEADGPRTLTNVTFTNTVNLSTNEIVPSYVWIENDHSSNTYSYFFGIGYDNSYVIMIDDIYYRSDSDSQDTISENKIYNSDGTITSRIGFGDPQIGEGWLDPGERLRVYIDWVYKGGTSDWYNWTKRYNFLGSKYHWLSGIIAPSSDYWSGMAPEVGTADSIQLLGDDVAFFNSNTTESGIEEEGDPFAEWREIQKQKKSGLKRAEKWSVTITNAEGEVILETESDYYKKNKEKIEEQYNLVPPKK